MKKYDYLIVGAGLYGATFARIMADTGHSCLVIDRRSHIGGNVYTDTVDGITVHRYGAHIFHTSDENVWRFVCRFGTFNNFINSPIARYGNEVYNLPFNMNTFVRLWGDVITAADARRRIAEQVAAENISTPRNLEEQALCLVGRDVYEKLIKGYTEKQWGRPCDELPADIIRRIPVRYTFDNNYFTDVHQGVPIGGYTPMIEKMLDGCDVLTDVDYKQFVASSGKVADVTVYSGSPDEYFDYRFGKLEYRSVRFEVERLPVADYQGNAVVNYTSADVPYTRIIEHKHFEFGAQPTTVISREYPCLANESNEPCYPINDDKNDRLLEKYRALAAKENNVIFGGRLGTYAYLDMDKVVALALKDAEAELKRRK